MIDEIAGITRADEARGQTVWHILGQTYTLKQVSESSIAWHALFPAGTFVPPHVHHTQEEYIYVLTGRYNLLLDGQEQIAEPGDLVRMPRGMPHGIFNKTDADATSLFWASPTSKLEQLFRNIDRVPDPADVVRICADFDVDFLPL
ncbi:cupin domain-containing protein [Stappia sp. 28M-7]|uniref:cupin domain-containing protein n=1 Tax=Stappia sp. 28M-7 TaxID=2762596 RepID=UPI00163BEA91|nr:cupin domain-containing protein [Stappia sp. 28M-7]MBC2860941.1 cupin domain-containing protein [Stappia sp. 28M-7]